MPHTTQIHPTAIIEPGARIAQSVSIGPYAYIGGQVELGEGTQIAHHATVEGKTRLGKQNKVFPYAYIGAQTHDLKYSGGMAGLIIGDHNVFREYVSVHLATKANEVTRVGNENTFLAYSHVAHDCQIGNHLIMSSHSALGGHVVVQDHVNVAWNAGVHQYCRIGAHAIVGACAKVVQDVPPMMTADGSPAEIRTINRIGLQRRGFSEEEIERARSLYKHFYRKGLNHTQAIESLKNGPDKDHWMTRLMLDFSEKTQRGWI